MSPLVCLCHGRLRLFGSRAIDSAVTFFSLVWVTFFSLRCAIPLGVAITGLIKLLWSHTSEVLPQVMVLALVLHYFWSCYKSFRKPHRSLAKSLGPQYQKRLDGQEQNFGVSALIHYKHEDFKVIPKDLLDDGRKEFSLYIKNDVMWLFVKLVFSFLLFLFVFLILRSDSVSHSDTTTVIITFLGGRWAYGVIDNAINNGEEFSISETEADKVVNDYIARKQQGSS